jgi:DUF1365 family protein
MLKTPKLFIGNVYHARHQPFFHEFKYCVFSLWVNVDDLDNNALSPRYFSFNKFNLLSLHKKNHGPRDGSPIRPWIEKAAKEKKINIEQIYMVTFPSVLGFIFSPLTIYFCYDENEKLIALLYQVKNTFGEQHGYLLAVEDDKRISQKTYKNFHVSPFIDMNCDYYFRVTPPDEKGFHIAIHQTFNDGKMLTATWNGQKAYDLNTQNIIKVFLKIPFMGIKIFAAIHWQALKLWVKGATFYKSPKAPNHDIS